MMKFWRKNWHYFILAAILIFLIIRYFSGLWFYDYLVPPGDDSFHHMTEAYNIIQEQGIIDPVWRSLHYNEVAYPPVFHILISSISLITGLNIIIVTQYFVRLLVILIIFNLYFIVKKIFKENKTIAVLSILSLVLFSSQPSQIYNEGTYLDLAAACFYLPLGLTFLILFFKDKKYFFPTILFFGTNLLAHHLSSIYLILILGVVNLLVLLSLVSKDKINYKKILLIDVSLLFFLFLAWNFYVKDTFLKIFNLIKSISGGSSQEQAVQSLDFIPTSLSQPPIFEAYILFLGFNLIFLGIIGLLFILFKSKNKIISPSGKIVIISWTAALFIASRFSAVQLPERFARDLYLPLAILAGLGLYQILLILRGYKKIRWIFYLLFILFIIDFIIPIFNKPNYNFLVRYQSPDDLAVEWIEKNTKTDDIFLGTPLVASSWGSFITLLSDRQVIPGDYCLLNKRNVENKCPVIYYPNEKESVEVYKEKNIKYVYAGKPFVGDYLWKDDIDYSYNEVLSKAEFLEIVFDETKKFGRVVIYKVNQDKLNNMYEQN